MHHSLTFIKVLITPDLKFKPLFIILLSPAFLLIMSSALDIYPIEIASLNKNAKQQNKSFYIESVADKRDSKGAISSLIPLPGKPAESGNLGKSIFEVEHYLKQGAGGANLRPIIINIKNLSINENALTDGRVEGKLELSFSYELKTGEDMWVHLIDYNASSHYIRPLMQGNVAETSLAKALDKSMVFLEGWMDKQNDNNPALARKVIIAFSDYKDDNDADTVYYDLKRPLRWDDFKAQPHNGRYAAEVIPGLGYTEKTYVAKGILNIEIAMKVFMPKSAAWVNVNSMNENTLNHEQRHFDITEIIGKHFKKRMLAESLPVLNYDGYINMAYFDALRELDAMQKKYDNETGHGTNMPEQQKWNKLIDTELALNYAAN